MVANDVADARAKHPRVVEGNDGIRSSNLKGMQKAGEYGLIGVLRINED
jgi:hypothetical protein